MPGLTRRRFLVLGLVSFLGVVLAVLWRVLGRLFHPDPGAVPESKTPPGETKPGTLQDPESFGTSAEHSVETGEKDAAPEKEERWKRPLGKTGVMVSIFGLGGGGIISLSDQEGKVIEMIHRALDLGVNFIDTAPSYGGGLSERHIGEVMESRRKEAFLATKTLERTYDGTMRLVEQSLINLQTDHLDLYQVHGIRGQEDVESIFKKNGVLRAMERLKNEGVIKYIGITGHRVPGPLRYAIEQFDFDCVLVPLNPAEVHFQSFQENLLPFAKEKGVGVIAMKVPAYGRLLREGGIESIKQALKYVYTLPISTAIVGLSSMDQLEENVRIARDFTPYSPEEMKNLEGLARPYQEEANFYKVQW